MTTRRLTLAVALSFLLALYGCASGRSNTGGSERNADVISSEEIRERDFSNTYDAIQSLRPQWLRVRAPVSFGATSENGEVVVYLDNVRYGDVQSLAGLRTEAVETVERISAIAATQRWGTGHPSGVIAVTTRRP